VTYQNRFVESNDHKRSIKANRFVMSEFGSLGYPDPCKSIFTRHFSYYFTNDDMTDNTNVNVVQMGDELYAMTETDTMHRIDPETLETVGAVNYKQLISVHGATAHPLQDLDGTTYNLGSCFGKQCTYHVIKTPPAVKGDTDHANKMSVLATLPAHSPRSPSYSHSFSITEKYFILLEQPLFISIFKLAAGKFLNLSFKDALQFRPDEKARFHIIDKATGAIHPTTFTADAFFFFHTINAYEDEGCVVLDVTAYDDTEVIDVLMVENLKKQKAQVPFNTRRFVFPLSPDKDAGDKQNLVTLKDECSATAVMVDNNVIYCQPQVFDCSAELPRINPDFNGRKYRFFYGVDFAPSSSDSTDGSMVQLVKLIWRSKPSRSGRTMTQTLNPENLCL